MLYSPGDFSFILDKDIREILTHDYNAVNSTEGAWEAFKNHNSEKPQGDSLLLLNTIRDNMSKQHSFQTTATSFQTTAMSFQTMECIAKDGWNKYVIMELTKKIYNQIFEHTTLFDNYGNPI